MFVFGHRGAAGLEPENTLISIEKAIKLGVDGIEFDVRITKDKKLVAVHDASLYRTTGKNRVVKDLKLKEISLLSTHSDHPIPTLSDILEITQKMPLLIDCKGSGWAKPLSLELSKHNLPKISITSENHKEMHLFMQLRPDIDTYVSELTHPFDAIKKAQLLGFSGVSLNFWVMNPLAYWQMRKSNLKIMLFTVNKTFICKFLKTLYPNITVISDFPDRLTKLRKKTKTSARN